MCSCEPCFSHITRLSVCVVPHVYRPPCTACKRTGAPVATYADISSKTTSVGKHMDDNGSVNNKYGSTPWFLFSAFVCACVCMYLYVCMGGGGQHALCLLRNRWPFFALPCSTIPAAVSQKEHWVPRTPSLIGLSDCMSVTCLWVVAAAAMFRYVVDVNHRDYGHLRWVGYPATYSATPNQDIASRDSWLVATSLHYCACYLDARTHYRSRRAFYLPTHSSAFHCRIFGSS